MVEYASDDDSPTTVFTRPRTARPNQLTGAPRMWGPTDVAAFLQ